MVPLSSGADGVKLDEAAVTADKSSIWKGVTVFCTKYLAIYRTSAQPLVVPLSSGADGVKFDEAAVGKGGAGFLWELHMDERQLTRTSLARPPPWSARDDDSSDEASVTTIEDISSEANEPTEGAVEVIPSSGTFEA